MPGEMKAADRYEREVADYINSLENVSATRPKVSTKYSDVIVEYRSSKAWLEVKMNHTDNLGNTRVSYDGERWVASKDGPINQFSLALLNASEEANQFVEDLKRFCGKTFIKIPTTKGGLADPQAVPLSIMKSFFEERDRYILRQENVDMGDLVTRHYLEGKMEPAHYMSAGDDLYMIGTENPLGLTRDLPLISGYGTFKMRISTRSRFYEVQPEIKITELPESAYSVKPGTLKEHPFELTSKTS